MDIFKTLIETFFDWPALLFGLMVFILVRHGTALRDLLASRKVDVELGGNKFSLGDAVEALSEQSIDDVRIIQKKLDALEGRIAAVETVGGGAVAAPGDQTRQTPTESAAPADAPDDGEILKRIVRAIGSSRFVWRSVERLALEAGVSEERVHDILARHHLKEVVLGKSKAGRVIARLP
ncbi:MAG: hypothetical protein KDJ77_10500 [Rhodobiaceae bacterium]|nr:hypothetical protein [Rhodobiaceae bacterium]